MRLSYLRPASRTRPAAGVETAADVSAPLGEAQGLHRALASRSVIEQAKGILMCRYQLDAGDASALLQWWSKNSHLKVSHLSTALTQAAAGGDHGAGQSADAVGWLVDQLHCLESGPADVPISDELRQSFAHSADDDWSSTAVEELQRQFAHRSPAHDAALARA